MKKYYILFFILTFVFFSCEDEVEIITEWLVSGTATINGTPSSSVKIAAFFSYMNDDFEDNPTSAIIVSNIENLGTTGNTFSLLINTDSISDILGVIDLGMWEDTNDNNLYDSGEPNTFSEANPNCPVFESGSYCNFEGYENVINHDDGWYYSNSSEVETLVTGDLIGAIISDNTYYW